MTDDMLDEQWLPSPQAAVSKVGEEMVLLHLGSGTYFGLDPLGARIWQGLEANSRPADLCSVIAEDYGEAIERVQTDVRALLIQLSEHDLIGRA